MDKPLTRWRKSNQEDSTVQRYLVAAMEESGLCIAIQNQDLEYLQIMNMPSRWKAALDQEPDDASIFGAEFAGRLAKVKAEALKGGETKTLEMMLEGDLAYEFEIKPFIAGDGSTYLQTIIRDISLKKSTERITVSLLREVSHRSKNLLAIIQSIATQTARHSDTLDTYLRRFRGRLYSLARAQDLITDSDWKGAMLKDLIHNQAQSYFPDDNKAIVFTGENILLSPSASLYLGLALHELIVQAASRRFISNGAQSIAVNLERYKSKGAETAPHAHLVWRENYAGAPHIGMVNDQPSDRMEFEQMLLEKIVPASLNGTASFDAGDNSVEYEITFPVSSQK
ncbi:sensor histidine kinase [Hoeflea sp. WL0058]|uniref:histidine kinase n=1 Tax=Flavimaribacter sediminis TaxID=2865987 RepID=A0AAE2ZIP7_9HYPH|nr:sensor histidine kinase [Flavimaribacter sediminis]MBW8636689.1 sensor histidine kinase [Flavimaribacter sediminis]